MRIKVAMIFALILCLGCGIARKNKIEDLMVRDFGPLLQLCLDADTLQPYFLSSIDSVHYPVIIASDAAAASSPLPQVEKFGRPVILISRAEADTSNFEACFWLAEYEWGDSSARIQLIDNIRNILFGASFQKVDCKWEITSTYVESW